MYKIKFLQLIIGIIFLFTNQFCNSMKKPDYIPQEDYSYLKKKNRTLLIARINLNFINNNYDDDNDDIINDKLEKLITIHNYQLSFTKKLIKEIYKYDKNKYFILDSEKKIEEKNIEYQKFIRKSYPNEFNLKKYNIIIEIDMNIFLFKKLNDLNISKNEYFRLFNANNYLYLSQQKSSQYNSIIQVSKIKNNKKFFKKIIQKYINLSAKQIALYILNLDSKPQKKNITPSLPKI